MATTGRGRRRWPGLRRGCLVAVAAVAVPILAVLAWPSLLDAWLAESWTAIETPRLADGAGGTVERARLTFRDDAGGDLARVDLAAGRLVPAVPLPGLPWDWGRRVTSVRVEAFGCDLETPVAPARSVSGALLGAFAPHPVPRTVRWTLVVEATCPAPGATSGAGWPIDFLVEELRSDREPYPDGAVAELARVGPAALPAVPALLEVVASTPASPLRYRAADALAAIGPAAAPLALARLIPLLADPEPAFRRRVAKTLDGLARGEPAVAEAYARVVRDDPDEETRRAVLRHLSDQGDAARAVSAAVVAVLRDESRSFQERMAAFSVLKKTALPEARPELERFAADHGVLW